jgi:glyoxylase-like metal-dependent hydrolase (beta-lactamase superfamily II)
MPWRRRKTPDLATCCLLTVTSLFPGGVGKTLSPSDFTSLIDEVETRVFGELPDDTWFYPGHGNDSTLGAERPHIAEWRARGW